MHLNPKQEEAKNKIDWPLLIIAWAWSWKTATLTARVEYMINEIWIEPNNILMVTFTNKAASEMRERVAKVLKIDTPRNIYSKYNFPLIWTFHSIWIFLLKEILSNFSSEELNIWLKKDFVIYDESDKLSVLKWIIKDHLNLNEKEFPARQIAFYISNAKNSLISARAYEKEVDSNIKEIVFKAYLKYEENLKQNNALDFDDILIKTLSLLKIPKILNVYQERYKYLMVDEYQDTNQAQYQIISLLAQKYRNLAVVWDDSQSIYSWRWADMKNIINFKKDYPDALIVKLEQNYRSTKSIISWANSVIANNLSWIKKELWTQNQDWEKINYIEAPDDKIEANTIASIIKEKNWNLKDNLILYRTNAQSRQIEEALLIKNIAYKVVWWQKFYDRKEIKDLLAYLKVVHNYNDSVSLKRIINTPTRKIWAKSIEILDNYKENFNLSYFQIIENIDEVEEIKNSANLAIKNFWIIINSIIEKSNQIVVWELIKFIVNIIKYDDYIWEWLTSDEKQSKLDNIDELITVASQYNWMEPRESLWQFLDEISLISDMDIKDERQDYVTLMTIHTSKWLEEKRVFITWLEDWIFPSFKSINDSHALEEERRLMYVAMTRAREELYISRSIERFHFWEYVRNTESRFLKEIPKDLISNYDLSEQYKNSQNIFTNNFWNYNNFENNRENIITKKIKIETNNDISQFKMWDKVNHPKFWNWIITTITWELAEIAFTWNWIKKMNIKIAPVRKL